MNYYRWLLGALVFLAALAAFSRIIQVPEAGKYITNASNALTKLFNGAFGL